LLRLTGFHHFQDPSSSLTEKPSTFSGAGYFYLFEAEVRQEGFFLARSLYTPQLVLRVAGALVVAGRWQQ
jgi:hypothetical protein